MIRQKKKKKPNQIQYETTTHLPFITFPRTLLAVLKVCCKFKWKIQTWNKKIDTLILWWWEKENGKKNEKITYKEVCVQKHGDCVRKLLWSIFFFLFAREILGLGGYLCGWS